MINKTLFLILLFLGINFCGFGQQLKQFTPEPEAYFDEMKALFSRDETNFKKGKELLDQFEVLWTDGSFSTHKQAQVYKISNLLLNKRARNFPHFFEFIQTLLVLQQQNIDSIKYQGFIMNLEHLLNNPKSKLTEVAGFINSIQHLFSENAVYYSNSMIWTVSNDNFTIELEGDTILYRFGETTLTGKLRRDSILIEETSGIFYPLTNTWKGDKAKIYWEKCGLDRNIAWAEIGEFAIELNKASYVIPHAKFYNKTFFDYSLDGSVIDKIVEVKDTASLSYPRFESSQKDFKIKGIFKDIDYEGGFSMQGSKLVGSGTRDKMASLSLFRDVELVVNGDTIIEKQLFMRTLSLYYAFKDKEIVSRNSKISMYIDTDSIYHPGLRFRYYDVNREINLIRDDDPENMSRSPYYNTYHKIEMDFELLRWNMGTQQIDLTMLRGSSINVANFESQDFFNAARYYEVQGLENTHPYISLRRCAKEFNSQTIYEEDLAKFMGYDLVTIRRMLIDFTYRGIVDYDSETGYFTLTPKLYKYLDAIVGRRDYDLIKLESQTLSPLNNAILNLRNMDLAIQGVPVINVSDSQNVVFYPKNQQILLKKDRDFDFSGRVEAGFFTFYGDNFQFKYDSFKVALNNVDSLSIQVKDGVDGWGRQVLANVKNVIEQVTGDVVIDDPLNKSGVKSNKQFPVFDSKKKSYVYYDAPNIQKGKYVRDRFYFVVDSYVIDSLNDFSPEGMGYEGELYSADIFPVIRQRLVLQPDLSLGFHHLTTETGLPLYKGKGNYVADIHLSNMGLMGNGEMSYLTSKTTSDKFLFYPDSTNVYTTNFTIGKLNTKVQYPEVATTKSYVQWLPYNDILTAKSLEVPFAMYGNKAMHKGNLLYTPLALTGNGVMDYNKGELASNLIKFKSDKFNADTANLKINSVNPGMMAFNTQNVNADVDFIAMKSSFKSNTGNSKVELNENLYHAYIQRFTWLMLDETMQLITPNKVQVYEKGKLVEREIEADGEVPIGSLFVSVHSGQDSLNWISPLADFDLKTNIISAHEVKYIDVADASLIPKNGEVVVEPMALMRTFKEAQLVANRDSKHHRFYGATLSVSSRKKYFGQGNYDYVDELGRLQRIHFDIIAVDSTQNSFARGSISSEQDFTLSPAFGYRGKVALKAPNKLLEFDGFTKIGHECDAAMQESWLKFESEIDPLNIFIPIADQPKDIEESFLVSGAMLATDSVHVFPAFLSPRKRYSNKSVITANGFLTYNSKNKQYIIAEKYRMATNDTTGNILTLQKNNCLLSGEGLVDLTAELGQIKIATRGSAAYNLPDDQLKLDLLMTLDFYFPEACIKFIADTLVSMTALKPVNLKGRTYQQGVKELLPYSEADALLKEQAIFGTVKKVPDLLSTTFVFSDLSMVWNKKETAWQSTGELGITNVKGTQINKKIKGNVAVTRKRSGDSFDLYLEISPTHWYYFNYKRGLMQAYSTEAAFNEIITNIKGGDRKLKVEQGEASYVFFLSNKKKRDDFLKILSGEAVEDSGEEENTDYEKFDDFD